MDDELFKQKLSEVADWKLPDTPRETSLNAKKRRGRKTAEEKYQEEHEEIFLEMFEGANPTYAPMIVKLKIKPEDCASCGDHCPNGRQVEAKHYVTNNCAHWRQHCKTCGQWEDPYTGKFSIPTGTESSIAWNSYHREVKGVYNSKGRSRREQTEAQKDSKLDQGIIRSWPDTLNPL